MHPRSDPEALPAGLAFAAAIPGSVIPDLDGDNDVDGDDFIAFEACASGPSIPRGSSETCQAADFDHDNDVDQDEFGVFHRCLSGPDVPADPNCAN